MNKRMTLTNKRLATAALSSSLLKAGAIIIVLYFYSPEPVRYVLLRVRLPHIENLEWTVYCSVYLPVSYLCVNFPAVDAIYDTHRCMIQYCLGPCTPLFNGVVACSPGVGEHVLG